MATDQDAPLHADIVEADELIALIKAIKFAYEDYGCKRVQEEIHSHGGKYATVPLKRVKKYMQKLGMTNTQAATAKEVDSNEEQKAPSSSSKPTKKMAKKKPTGDDNMAQLCHQAQAAIKQKQPIQLMTVGGKSKSQRPTTSESVEETNECASWLPVKLDEPASKINDFPYQAVIRMTHSDEGAASGDMGEIYKIQVAMEPDGSLSSVHPMLVYNKARSRKTFLHPDSPAYSPVQRLIADRGFNGAVGGAKAYFWGRYRQADDMLYIHTDKLAPFQKW